MKLMAQKTRMCGFSAAPLGARRPEQNPTQRVLPRAHTAEVACAAGEQPLPGNLLRNGHQGKRQAAREVLAPVYGWSTERFDKRDLKEAKQLLEELAP